MLTEAIGKLKLNENLDFDEAKTAFEEIVSQKAKSEDVAEFLSLLADKGETAEEIAAAVSCLKSHALMVNTGFNLLDTCGTGGDGKSTFNISTASAIVCSLFVKVAKHGNRAITSKSGSADLLNELGIPTQLKPDEALEFLKRNDFVFLFAPVYHPAVGAVAEVRKQLKRRTIFNLIGPLLNPFEATSQLIGVFSREFLARMFDATRIIGMKNVCMVSSFDGLDEISIASKTKCFIRKNDIEEMLVFDPEELNISGSLEDIKGFDAKTNAKLLIEAFEGKHEKLADAIALNAAFALFVADMADSVEEGFRVAKEAITKGKALEKLLSLRMEDEAA